MNAQDHQIHEGVGTFDPESPGQQSVGAAVPVEVVVALAQGAITHREALGISDESLREVTEYGHRLLEHQYYEQAAVIFDALATLDPDVPYFHLGLATAMRNLGHKKGAMDEYEKAKKLDPKDITPHVNQARILLQDGRRREARKLLEAARSLDPKGRHPFSAEAKILWMTQIEPA